jgi:hypothetical protein
MRTVPQCDSPSWWCEHCNLPQYQPRRIYAVPLCYLCIAERAEQPGFAYYTQCRVYELEKENKRLQQLVTRLLGRTEQADGPCEPLGEWRRAKLTAIAFAALITAFGKPIHIVLEDTETGRTYWVEPDKGEEKDDL